MNSTELSGNIYYVDSNETDIGAAGKGRSLKDLIDKIGSTDATIKFLPGDYTLTTPETVPSNIRLKPENGAIIDGAGTLTVYSPENIAAHPNQQIFGSSITVAFSKDCEGFAEWWGIDGTADEVQINKALTACSVKLLKDTTYDITDSITMVANRTLTGGGYTTVLSDSRGTATATGIINAASVNDWEIKDLKIDGQSADGTANATERGIHISGTSARWKIKDVWIYDVRQQAIYARGGRNAFISNVYISEGCLSSGIIIGPKTGDTDSVYNIQLDNITIEDVNRDGLGIWDQNDTHITTDITVNNLIVKGCAKTSTGHGFWTHDAGHISLNNFQISDTNDNSGNGLHFEYSRDSSISNGTVYDSNYGIQFSDSGGISDEIIFSNIRLDACNIGINGPKSYTGSTITQYIQFNNILMTNCVLYGYYMGGKNIIINGCITKNTTSNKGFYIAGDGSDVADKIQIVNCQSEDQIGWHFKDNTDCIFRNNLYYGGAPGSAIGRDNIADLQEVKGDAVSVKMYETLAAGDSGEYFIFSVSQVAHTGVIISNVWLAFSADITQDDTDYITFVNRARTSTGGLGTNMGSVTTKATDGTDFDDNIATLVPTSSSNRVLVAGEGFSIDVSKAASGQATTDAVCMVNYLSF